MSVEELILNNRGLIYKCIKDLNCRWATEDEFQSYYDAGEIGLIQGAKAYNEDKGNKSTFLYTCIKNQISRQMYLSERDKRKIHKTNMLRLDEIVNETSEDTYLDFMEDPKVNIEKEIFKKIEYEKILEALKYLKPRQRFIIECKFGLNGREELTINEIAAILKNTKQATHSSYNNAIKNLKRKVKELNE